MSARGALRHSAAFRPPAPVPLRDSTCATCLPDLCPNPLASTSFASSPCSGHPQVGWSVCRPGSNGFQSPVECEARFRQCRLPRSWRGPPARHNTFAPLRSGARRSEMLLRKIHPACPRRVCLEVSLSLDPRARTGCMQSCPPVAVWTFSSSPRQRQVARPGRCTPEADRSPVKSKPLIRNNKLWGCASPAAQPERQFWRHSPKGNTGGTARRASLAAAATTWRPLLRPQPRGGFNKTSSFFCSFSGVARI